MQYLFHRGRMMMLIKIGDDDVLMKMMPALCFVYKRIANSCPEQPCQKRLIVLKKAKHPSTFPCVIHRIWLLFFAEANSSQTSTNQYNNNNVSGRDTKSTIMTPTSFDITYLSIGFCCFFGNDHLSQTPTDKTNDDKE